MIVFSTSYASAKYRFNSHSADDIEFVQDHLNQDAVQQLIGLLSKLLSITWLWSFLFCLISIEHELCFVCLRKSDLCSEPFEVGEFRETDEISRQRDHEFVGMLLKISLHRICFLVFIVKPCHMIYRPFVVFFPIMKENILFRCFMKLTASKCTNVFF